MSAPESSEIDRLRRALQALIESDLPVLVRLDLAAAVSMITKLEWSATVFRATAIEVLEALEPYGEFDHGLGPDTNEARRVAEERLYRVKVMLQVLVDLTK